MRERAVFIGVACAVLVIVLIVVAVSLLPGSAPETAQVLLPEDTSPPASENADGAEKYLPEAAPGPFPARSRAAGSPPER